MWTAQMSSGYKNMYLKGECGNIAIALMTCREKLSLDG
jgi:hypothetical protein